MTTRTLALLYGIFWLGFAVLSMMPGMVVPMSAGAPETRFDVMYGALFGMFPVNMTLTLIHLFMGAWGLAAYMGWNTPRTYAHVAAIVFAVLGVLGLIPVVNTLWGVMPLHGHSTWLHLGAAALAAYVGWQAPIAVGERERRSPRGDRRQASRAPIAGERRQGLYDRRRSAYIPQA